MTKRNLLLVSLFLVFGLVTMATTALAGTQWIPGSSPNNFGRAEGLTEETGIYTLTNNVAGTVEYGDYFTVTYYGGTGTTALPAGTVVSKSVYLQCTGPDFPLGCTNSYPLGSVVATQSGNSVTVKFVQSPFAVFVITGDEIAVIVRVNATNVANQKTCPNYVWGVGVFTNASNAGTNTISITGTPNTPFPVLLVNCEPTLSLTFAAKDRSVEHANGIAGQVLNCIGATDVGPYDKSFCVNVDEEFPNALTSYSYELLSDTDALNGTDFTITLTGVPTTMTIGTPTVTPCGSFASTDPSYCATATYTPTLAVSTGSVICTADSPVPTPPTQTCTVTFVVTSEDAGQKENMDICFKYWTHGPIPTGYTEIYANVAKGPTPPATAIPLFTGVEEGVPTPWNLSVVDFSDCQTVLLYPFVLEASGYTTGIAVANTTLDPFNVTPGTGGVPVTQNGITFPNLPPTYGKGSAVQQTGPCFFYIYSGGALAGAFARSAITPGTVDAFFLSNEVPGLPNPAYAIAVCEFQNAHGYAAIQYEPTAGTLVTMGNYLALVLPDPAFYHRSPAGDMLGESADAPWYMNNFWKYSLIYVK